MFVHIAPRFQLGQQCGQEAREVASSVIRGLDLARQSAVVDLKKIARCHPCRAVFAPCMAVFMPCTVMLPSLLVLRELEAA